YSQYSQSPQYSSQYSQYPDSIDGSTNAIPGAVSSQYPSNGTAGSGNVNSQSPYSNNPSGRDQINKGAAKAVNITIPAPDIDWSYAVIERKDPVTLKSTLVPFNLGKLVLEHDLSEDKELQPEDVVTIFSQADIVVPREQQTKFV